MRVRPADDAALHAQTTFIAFAQSDVGWPPVFRTVDEGVTDVRAGWEPIPPRRAVAGDRGSLHPADDRDLVAVSQAGADLGVLRPRPRALLEAAASGQAC